MPRRLTVLDDVRVASPCPVDWESMSGDARVRFCPRCDQHVFNLSGMRRAELEDLIREKQGQLCIRYYQRTDGAVMTRDCPEGAMRKLRRQAAVALSVFLGILFALFAWGGALSNDPDERHARHRLRDHEPFRTIFDWIDPTPRIMLGSMCAPPEAPGGDPPADLPPMEPKPD